MSASSRVLAKSLIKLAKEQPAKTDAIMDEFFSFLEKNNLLGNSAVIMRHLETYKKEEELLETLHIRSANEVSPELLKDLKEKLGVENDAKIAMETSKDNIGGVTAEYRGKVLDASTNTIINRLTQTLNE